MKWVVVFSDNSIIDEESIIGYDNPKNVSPWLVLLDHMERNNLTIKSLSFVDEDSSINIYSPGKIAGKLPDSIDFRKRYIGEGMHSSMPFELYGMILTKDSITVGIWYNKKTKEVFTTFE
jgi:hypothetical protein